MQKEQNTIKGCIFDSDGTLIDTSEFVYTAFEFVLKAHGFPMPTRQELVAKTGKPLHIDYTTLTGLADTTLLCAEHRKFQNEHQHLVKAFPGVVETLANLKKLGIKLAVVTTRSKITSIQSLQSAGIDTYFDVLLSLEDVVHPKPDPECILKCLDLFGLQKSKVMMIGDRDTDILAGKNACVQTIGVTYGYFGQTIKESHPDHVIEDIRELIRLV